MSAAGAAPGAGERDLVFVGGTGRSGTHALARLIGSHPRFADVPIEARFHCNKRGLPELIEGRVGLRGFVEKLRGFWWHRVRVDGRPRGLYNLMTEATFERAIAVFEERYGEDPLAAGRDLFCDLLAPVALRAGKPGLVEMSSHNVREAQTLLRLFPEARVIHTARDGRDAAASVSGKTWGPESVVGAVGWWERRMREIQRGVASEEDGARWEIPAGRFHLLVLGDLVGPRREAEYARLLDFLGVEDGGAMREHFERHVTPEAAHPGRWRERVGPLGRARVARRYERALERLEREGNHAGPALRAALEREKG